MIEDTPSHRQDIEVDNSIPNEGSTRTEASGRIRQPIFKAWYQIKNLNLFATEPPSTDDYQLESQRISTRLFIFLLIISLTEILIYTSAVSVSKTVVIQNPDYLKYKSLYDSYKEAVACACTHISINYEIFLSINHTLHQICRSAYVSDEWVQFILNSHFGSVPYNDFRIISLNLFQALKYLCEMIEQFIANNLVQFYAINYVSDSVTSAEILKSQSEALIKEFIESMTNNFVLSMRRIRDTTQVNALYSALHTNYIMNLPYGSNNVFTGPLSYNNNCSCGLRAYCGSNAIIYQNNSLSLRWLVPGFYQGCFIVEALRQSDLRCFYNQKCLADLIDHMQSLVSTNATILDISLPSQYSPNTAIGTMLDQLLIENWTWSTFHENYYTECRPSQCTYTLKKRNSAIYIATTLFGLIGGLVTALNLLVPRIVWVIRSRNRQSGGLHIRQIICSVPTTVVHYITDLNVFPATPPSNNSHELRIQKISTRLFIVLLAFSLIILTVYTSLAKVTEIAVVRYPDFNQYQQLYQVHQQALTCPCKQISTTYNKFLNISYTLHQLCKSYFVTDQWIQFLDDTHNSAIYILDFRTSSRYYFQALQSLCELTEKSLSTSIARFFTNDYVSAMVVSMNLFHSQLEAFIQQFIISTVNSFSLSLWIIRDTTQINQLLSGLSTNTVFSAANIPNYVVVVPKVYSENCSCDLTYTCTKSFNIFMNNNLSSPWLVPGFYQGCFVLESLRQSDFRCFYNQTCFMDLMDHMQAPSSTNSTLLDTSLPSQYSPNTTIGTMLDQLFIENWNWSIIYENYYTECNPSQCSYTLKTRNSAIYIVTTVIGLIGGLVTALKRTISWLVWLIIRKRRGATVPHAQGRTSISLNYLKRYIININLFASVPPTTDPHDLKLQLISTKVFIVLLSISLTVLLIYTSTVRVTKTATIEAPNSIQYRQLYELYQETLICPCKQVAVSYNRFLQINFTLHPVCDSFLVSDRWISVVSITSKGPFFANDFRRTSMTLFQALRYLCILTQNVIGSSLLQFYETNYVSSLITPIYLFESQAQTYIQQFIQLTASNFIFSLRAIRDMTQANGLLSVSMTGYVFYITAASSVMLTYYYAFDNMCRCDLSSTCTTQARIFMNNSVVSPWMIPGIYTGCFSLESFRQSDLTCFYNETCLSEFLFQINQTSLVDTIIMNSSLLEHFSIDTKFDTMIDELLVESWNSSIFYENYFSTCDPEHCTYKYLTRNDAIYIITTLIGLVGGLITALKLVVPRVVPVVFKFVQRGVWKVDSHN